MVRVVARGAVAPAVVPAVLVAVLAASLSACGAGGRSEPTVQLDAIVPGAALDEAVDLGDGTVVHYEVVTPPGFEPGEPHPVLLALPPGAQTPELVRSAMELYWAEAERRDWVVLSPASPDGRLFGSGTGDRLESFLAATAGRYPPSDGRYHVAGVSNGGLGAFSFSTHHPDLVASVLVIPGYASRPRDKAALDALAAAHVPVAMYVGEHDTGWVAPARETAALLREAGGEVELTVVADESHVITSVSGADLFDQLESY